ncbi:DUF5590 domain-containing protein [Pediococcus acidilactici]
MKKSRLEHPFLLIVFIVAASIIGSAAIIFNEINRPIRGDTHVAKTIALDNTDLAKVDRVTRFVYNQTEYTVSGSKKDGMNIFVVIADHGKKITVYPQSAGVSEQAAIKTVEQDSSLREITSSRFGIVKKRPVWMISYINQKDHLVIKLIDFKTGQEIKHVSTY